MRCNEKMKLLLIYPSTGQTHVTSKVHVPIGAFLPPLGLLYLARMVELQGHSVEIIDYNAEVFNETILQKSILSSDAIGMTILSQPEELEHTVGMAKKIKQFDPNIPLIIGGPHCLFLPEQALRDHQADICVRGEGEYIIGPLIETIEGKRCLSSIPGIIYRQKEKINSTELQPQNINLDSLPFPARYLVKKYQYGYTFGAKTMKGKVTSIISSRGCPCLCTFCQLSSNLTKYRTRSVTNTTQEIDEIVEAGYNSIAFADDNFLADKKRVEQIMDHIIGQKYDITLWILDTRVDSTDRKLYEKMRDAGVKCISFGIESGNQDILNFYNKKITLEQVRKAIKLSKEMGFFIKANFIIGAPIETKKHIQRTIKFSKSLSIDFVYYNHLEYIVGTPLWQQAVRQGKINPEESVVKSDKKRGLALYNAQEIEKFCINAYYSFYLNPMFWLREINYALRNHDPQFIQNGLQILTKRYHKKPQK